MDLRHLDQAQLDRLWHTLRDDLRRHGADLQTAEDIAQQACLVALRRPPEERGRFHGWLHVVAIRLLRRSRVREGERSRRECLLRAPASELPSDPTPQGVDPLISLLHRCVEELPDPYRTALRLRFFEDRDVAEIAIQLDVPKATVHTHIKRGIRRLRARVDSPDRRGLLAGFLLRVSARVRALLPRPALPTRTAGVLGLVSLAFLAAGLAWSVDGERTGFAARNRERSTTVRPSMVDALLPPARRALEAGPAGTGEEQRFQGERLHGVVRTPLGAPLAGARVQLARIDGSVVAQVISDREGRYATDATGELVWATHPDWCDSWRSYVPSARTADDLDLVLEPTRGRAWIEVVTSSGAPVEGATIQLDVALRDLQTATARGTLEFSGQGPSARTDADGRAWLRFPDRTTSELFVVAPEQPGWRGTVQTPGEGDVLRVTLPSGVSLAGTLRDEAGHPLWRARVEVVQLAGLALRTALTDTDGVFRIADLTPGDFILRAREAGPGRASARFAGSLEPGQDPCLALTVSELDSILGRVLDEGRPAVGARVELWIGNPQPAEGLRRIEFTDANGGFAFAGCGRTLAHDLHVFRPGLKEPSAGLEKLRPGRGEALVVLPAELDSAPIELAFHGARLPALVELRRDYPASSLLLTPSETGAGRFRSASVPMGTYQVFAWHAETGTWEAGSLEHEPWNPRMHALRVPDTGTLVLAVALPEGVECEDVVVEVPAPSLPRYGLERLSSGNGRRRLAWSEAERAFVGSLPPGTHTLIVGGSGLAESQLRLVIEPGARTHVTLAPSRGVETTLYFECLIAPELGRSRSCGMQPGEVVELEAFTPTDRHRFELPAWLARRVEGGFEFPLRLPPDLVELRVRTKSPATRFVPREGRCSLDPHVLASAAERSRIRIPIAFVIP